MHTTHFRRALRCGAQPISTPTAMAVICLTFAAASPLLAAPLTVGGPGHSQPSRSATRFAQQVDSAVDLIRQQVLEAPACRAYFARFGVDLDAWLSPDQPPYVIPRPLGFAPWRRGESVCGGAQSRPPFEFLAVDQRCFRGRRLCDLASLLLHEMGHLARRDTRDNEPPEFFLVCRLSRCVDPAKFW